MVVTATLAKEWKQSRGPSDEAARRPSLYMNANGLYEYNGQAQNVSDKTRISRLRLWRNSFFLRSVGSLGPEVQIFCARKN